VVATADAANIPRPVPRAAVFNADAHLIAFPSAGISKVKPGFPFPPSAAPAVDYTEARRERPDFSSLTGGRNSSRGARKIGSQVGLKILFAWFAAPRRLTRR